MLLKRDFSGARNGPCFFCYIYKKTILAMQTAPISPQPETARSAYLEYIAKLDSPLIGQPVKIPTGNTFGPVFRSFKIKSVRQLEPRLTCQEGFISGQCTNGHKWAKSVICAKEWCTVCGKKESDLHRRRYFRWWDKAHSLNKVGKIVITFPTQWHDFYSDLDTLRRFRISVKSHLKKSGYKKGLMRWHWAGDCQYCKKWKGVDGFTGCKHCRFTGSGSDFRPHLNIVIESGFLNPAKLDIFLTGIKQMARDWAFANGSIMDCDFDILPVVNYTYGKTPEQITHAIKYITRPTARLLPPDNIRLQLHKFRSSQTWGKFEPCKFQDELPIEYLTRNQKKLSWIVGSSKPATQIFNECINIYKRANIISRKEYDAGGLAGGACTCGANVKWGGYNSAVSMRKFIRTENNLSGGYYAVKNDGPPPPILQPNKYFDCN